MYKANSPRPSIRSIPLSVKPLAVAAALFIMAGHAHATVNGGTVAAGAATISTNGDITTINQSTDRAVINWNSFDIGVDEKVQINQPASTSAILNRINGTAGTRIDGELNANGRVFVVNPNGIVVGESGKINANGVTLSTLDVSDANFMQQPSSQVGVANTLNFRRGAAPESRVVNDGTITSKEGGISLLGGQVINSATGTLEASGNQQDFFSTYVNNVNLVAADSVDASQDLKSQQSITYSGLSVNASNANSSSDASNLVVNDGAIAVRGGNVTFRAASNAGNEAIRNTGSIDVAAFSVPSKPSGANGGVELRSGNGSVYVGGAINSADPVTLVSTNGPLTIDGSVTSGSYVGLGALGNASANILVNDRADVAGLSVLVSSDESVLIDGKLTANVSQYGNVDIYGRTIAVNGLVSGVSINFWGDSVQWRQGSLSSMRNYVNGKLSSL